ncbi:hypothetical protein NQ317_017727, partial [Molorchus minor]
LERSVLFSLVLIIAGSSKQFFLTVAKDESRRNDWVRVLNLKRIPDGGRYTVCEDHFDLEDDSTNWMFYKIMGVKADVKK